MKIIFFYFLLSEFNLGKLILIGLAHAEVDYFYSENGMNETF